MDTPASLESKIGQLIGAIIPFIGREKILTVWLHGVETGGIWIESQETTNCLLEHLKTSRALKTPIFFIPYSQIQTIIDSIDQVAISEKAFSIKP
jgi:hypothetical protein